MASKRRNHKKLIMEQKKEMQTVATQEAEVKSVETVKKEEKKKERKLFLQYEGLEFSDSVLFEAAENDYCQKYSANKEDIENIDLYVKPEDSKAYYVVNGDTEKVGSIDL